MHSLVSMTGTGPISCPLTRTVETFGIYKGGKNRDTRNELIMKSYRTEVASPASWRICKEGTRLGRVIGGRRAEESERQIWAASRKKRA
jgi:hypothetical protein